MSSCKLKICVIGAGAAGLAAIRHVKHDPLLEGTVFEQTDGLGGVWKYTDQTGKDEVGIPIQSTAYKGLRTNLPKEIMGFLEYPFPPSDYSYIMHDEVLSYLDKYSKEHNLTEMISFRSRVVNVEPHFSDDGNGKRKPVWKVQVENLNTSSIAEHDFDGVIVCNGHYTKPLIPEIENIEDFKGEVVHTRDYRTPEPFAGKVVIVLGGGPSAIDISLEINSVAAQIILCCKPERLSQGFYKLPENYTVHSPVIAAKPHSFVTSTGVEVGCDVLLLCTGYQYDFPFLSPECGITVKGGKYVFPLYRHMINPSFPSMVFIGIPFAVCPFPHFDCQIRYLLKALKGELQLPSTGSMMEEIKKEESFRAATNVILSHSHKLGEKQWEYNRVLAEEGGFSHLLKPVVQKLYNKAGDRRGEQPANYKYDQVAILDDESYEYTVGSVPE